MRKKMLKWNHVAAVLLAMAVAVLQNGYQDLFYVQAAKASVEDQVFDAGYYARINPDVTAAVGVDTAALYQHYKNFGAAEGRSASATFNARAYKAANLDLWVYGSDWAAYAKHYIEHGIAEGRSGNGAEGAVVDGWATAQTITGSQRVLTYEDQVGNSYIEIDWAAQHLYVFVGGALLLESDLVSGKVSDGHTTPAGIYAIKYKTTDVVLRGEDYEAPVKYWMPFNGGIGLHDANWRSKFGGTIYERNGSHGCINMPTKKAETLYGLAYKGMPVVCHY